MSQFTCECGATAMATCKCFFPECNVVMTFDQLLEYCMQDRRPRHWLANKNFTFAHGIGETIQNARNGDFKAWHRLSQFAITGSIVCQKALLDFADVDMNKVIEELNRAMDHFDESPVCNVCGCTDLCSCKTGSCPACFTYDCKAYACCMHLPGAEEAYRKTFGAEVPVRRHPTTVMGPVADTMRNAAKAILDACALPCPSRDERSGLTFFMLPRMNPALDVAWRNAEWPYRRLDGRCFCKTCNNKFKCNDWDINPHINCCDGDCDTCPECIRKEIVAGHPRY